MSHFPKTTITEEIRTAQESAKAEMKSLEHWYNIRRSQIMQELDRINNVYYQRSSEINTKWATHILDLQEQPHEVANPVLGTSVDIRLPAYGTIGRFSGEQLEEQLDEREQERGEQGPMCLEELSCDDEPSVLVPVSDVLLVRTPEIGTVRGTVRGTSTGVRGLSGDELSSQDKATDDELIAMESGLPRTDLPMSLSELATVSDDEARTREVGTTESVRDLSGDDLSSKDKVLL